MTSVLESVIIKSTKNKGDENMKKRILKWLYIACLTTLVATVSFIIGVMCYIIWWWRKMNKYKIIAVGDTYISCIVYANSEQEAVAQFQGYEYVEATLIES